MIIDTVQVERLYKDLREMNRDNFSREGARALMEYLNCFAGNVVYDPIRFYCEYTEFASFSEFQHDYPEFQTLEQVEEEATVIKIPGGDAFIISTDCI